MFFQPLTGIFHRLFNQGPHRQAINEAAWPVCPFEFNSIPQPGQNGSGSFAESCGDIDKLRLAGCARVATSKSPLVVKWFMARCATEIAVETRQVHRSPPSTISSSRCLILNCMRSEERRVGKECRSR